MWWNQATQAGATVCSAGVSELDLNFELDEPNWVKTRQEVDGLK